jgi:hypothetical protein
MNKTLGKILNVVGYSHGRISWKKVQSYMDHFDKFEDLGKMVVVNNKMYRFIVFVKKYPAQKIVSIDDLVNGDESDFVRVFFSDYADEGDMCSRVWQNGKWHVDFEKELQKRIETRIVLEKEKDRNAQAILAAYNLEKIS